MIGTLDQDTYFARRTALQASIATAQHDYDQASLAAELSGDLTFDVTGARANMAHLEDRLHSLDRAWVVAQENAAKLVKVESETERLAAVEELKSRASSLATAAKAMEAAFFVFLDALRTYLAAFNAFRSQLTGVTTGSPHQDRTLGYLIHNPIGACILGKLREADLPNLDDYDAIEAMRAFKSQTPSGIARERLMKSMGSAAQDITELENWSLDAEVAV